MKIKTIKNTLLLLGASALSLLSVSCFHSYPVRPSEPPKDPNDKPPVTGNPNQGEEKPKDPNEGGVPVEPPSGGNPFEPNTSIPDPTKPADADSDIYKQASLLKKYYMDEAAYINALIRYLYTNGETEAYNEIYETYNRNHVDKFNLNADKLKLPAFLDSYVKNFSVTDDNNNLVLNPLKILQRRKYWADKDGDRGTARYIPNELYRKILGETYSIIVTRSNKYLKQANLIDGRTSQGTAWILDYATNDQNQITKLYLATNLHVASDITTASDNGALYTNVIPDSTLKQNADTLISANKVLDKLTPSVAKLENEWKQIKEKYGENSQEFKEIDKKYAEALIPYDKAQQAVKKAENNITGITTGIKLAHFDASSTPIETELKQTNKDTHVSYFNIDPDKVKIVYAGSNFLATSPSEYLSSNSPYRNLEEMADFAVLEISFDPQKQDYIYQSPNENEELNDETINSFDAYMLYLTSAYQNNDNSRPANFDLLTRYDQLWNDKLTVDNEQVSKIKYDFLALGFPNSGDDDDLKASLPNGTDVKSLSSTSSVWVNKSRFSNDNNYGGGFSQNVSLRTFIDKPGLTDILISNPIINAGEEKGFEIKYLKEKDSSYTGNSYINYGLGYVLHNWQPATGGSGSSVRDIDGNILGITFAAADAKFKSLVSLTQALRSPGYDYKGQYGKYNLEQYDLIYGGCPNQRTSYRQALQKIYGDNFRTKLFPNGVSNIPDEYKFNK
ncbi:Ig-specific serine endopeptidase MIP [Mycoplasma sp. Z463D]